MTQDNLQKYPQPKPECYSVIPNSKYDGALIRLKTSDGIEGHEVPIPATDADPQTPDFINRYELAGATRTNLWKRKIGAFLARGILNPVGVRTPSPDRCALYDFPKGYNLYVHKKGHKAAARTDTYLVGSRTVFHFRSPAEFFFHAAWLMAGMPVHDDGRPNCLCKYCGGTDQGVISETFSAYHRASRIDKAESVTRDIRRGDIVRSGGVTTKRAKRQGRSKGDASRQVNTIKAKDYTSLASK